MRKWGKPAPTQEGERRSACAERDTAEPETRLEDDGFVFWPHSLGQPGGPRLVQIAPRPQREPEQPRPPRRRLATSLLFTLLFFAGAALTAAAGNEVATIVASSAPGDTQSATGSEPAATTAPAAEPSEPATSTSETTTETTTTSESSPTETAATSTDPALGDVNAGEPAPPAPSETTAADSPASDQPSGDGSSAEAAPDAGAVTTPQPSAGNSGTGTVAGDGTDASAQSAAPQPEAIPQPVLPPQPGVQAPTGGHAKAKRAAPAYPSLHTAPRERQIEHEPTRAGLGTVRWINEPLPDPTPPSLRLSAQFVRDLRAASSTNGLGWSFLLAVLRAERLDSSGELSQTLMQREAAALAPFRLGAGDRRALLAYKHDAVFAERVLVLDRYYRALGLNALVKGLVADRDRLAARVLADPRVDIYPDGREDISNGHVDVRVLAMIAYLAESFGEVRVSCLITGHRLYARPGVISAHIYGRALDIGALDGASILGHQQAGSVTEQAVRQILLLPAEMVPRQVISLIGLGGPSFALTDHNDHIHIGY